MTAARAALVVVAALALGAGCDVKRLVLESELAPAVRDDWVRDCCECLAHGQTALRGDACSGEELPPVDDPDGGPLQLNPCLCELDADTCGDLLIAGVTVEVVGACTALGGPCHFVCEGVLAYP